MESVCTHCGAPARAGIIVCEFCENPVDIEAAKHAIGCKKCSTLNVETAQQCLKCKEWLVVQCLFCSQVSRHDLPVCASCREPFAGAAERKASRDADLRRQQMFNTAVAVAPLAGSLLGGVAGAVFGSSFNNPPSYPSYHASPSSHHASGNVRGNDSSGDAGSLLREVFSSGNDASGNDSNSSSTDESSQAREGSVIDTIAEAFSDDDENNSRG